MKNFLNKKIKLSTVVLFVLLGGCSLIAKWCDVSDGDTLASASKEIGWLNKDTGCWNWTDKAPICRGSKWFDRVPGLHPGTAIDLKVLGDKYNTDLVIDSMTVFTKEDRETARGHAHEAMKNLNHAFDKIFYDVTPSELRELGVELTEERLKAIKAE